MRNRILSILAFTAIFLPGTTRASLFASFRSRLSSFRPTTVVTEDYYFGPDTRFYEKPKITKSLSKPFRITRKLHKKACETYKQELIDIVRYREKGKNKLFDIKKKIQTKVYAKVRQNIAMRFKAYGVPVEEATPNDAGYVIRDIRKDSECEKYRNKIEKELGRENYYQKVIECMQQKDQTKCRAENKKLLNKIAAKFYAQYYECDKGNWTAGKNFFKKPIPVNIGLAAAGAGWPASKHYDFKEEESDF